MTVIKMVITISYPQFNFKIIEGPKLPILLKKTPFCKNYQKRAFWNPLTLPLTMLGPIRTRGKPGNETNQNPTPNLLPLKVTSFPTRKLPFFQFFVWGHPYISNETWALGGSSPAAASVSVGAQLELDKWKTHASDIGPGCHREISHTWA